MKIHKHIGLAGWYRTESVTDCWDNRRFGQMHKKSDGMWHAEIRDGDTGQILQYAGIWKTLRDAVEEVESTLNR